jgi:hypothetical protein
MRILILILAISVFSFSCTKKVEKPAVTIGHYSKQVVQITEVITKLMNEPDVKVMNFMADGVESTRAISCDAVGEECNAYYEFINKIVDVTKDGELSAKDREILVQYQQRVFTELKKSDIKIQQEWKDYINSGNKD